MLDSSKAYSPKPYPTPTRTRPPLAQASLVAPLSPRERQRRKRRRARRRQLGFLAVLLVVLYGLWRLVGTIGMALGAEWAQVPFRSSWTYGKLDTATQSALTALIAEDSRLHPIAERPEQYPTELLELLVRNPETADFVLNYPQQHTNAPARTLSESLDTMPLLLQWDERWGYHDYGSSTIAVSGCGPTALAMVAAYLTQNDTVTPYVVAQYAAEQGYYVAGTGTSWDCIRNGAPAFGVQAEELPLDEGVMNAALDDGKPIICSMLPGDFTTTGHFIVLSGYTEDGYQVHDPNSRDKSNRYWTYDQIKGQIGNLWACSPLSAEG